MAVAAGKRARSWLQILFVNISLQEGEVPQILKEAIVQLLFLDAFVTTLSLYMEDYPKN